MHDPSQKVMRNPALLSASLYIMLCSPFFPPCSWFLCYPVHVAAHGHPQLLSLYYPVSAMWWGWFDSLISHFKFWERESPVQYELPMHLWQISGDADLVASSIFPRVLWLWVGHMGSIPRHKGIHCNWEVGPGCLLLAQWDRWDEKC